MSEDAPEQIYLRNVERDGHRSWVQSSGFDNEDVAYFRWDLATCSREEQAVLDAAIAWFNDDTFAQETGGELADKVDLLLAARAGKEKG